jgi:hypothetical protein
MFSPKKRMLPDEARCTPVSKLTNVVFPAVILIFFLPGGLLALSYRGLSARLIRPFARPRAPA